MRMRAVAGSFLSGIALSATIALCPASYSLTPVNTIQNGRIIHGGSYYNTSSSKTTFLNSGSGGLWLKSGTTVRGLEVNTSGNLTNNGGTIQLYAPDNVVRVDGTIDVSAIRNGQGAYLGNGGKFFVDSGYLFQNGNIFANGMSGGLVQINVGGMTLGAGAQIQAKGSVDTGGTVAINSAGPVDLRRNSSINTSGGVFGNLDPNLINIEGGLVNNEGTLRADGLNSRGGTIRLVASGQSDYQYIKDTLQAATLNPYGDNTTPTITPQERTFLLQRNKGLIDAHDGDVFLSKDTTQATPSFVSNLSANAVGGIFSDPQNDYTQSNFPRVGDGGNIFLTASRNVENLGTIRANGASAATAELPFNGGYGGTIVLTAQGNIINNKGRLEANGGNGGASTTPLGGATGGNGGLIAFGYNGTMSNSGNIYADGAVGGNGFSPGQSGNGGLVVLSGNGNPTGNGSIDVIARAGGNNDPFLGGISGTIVSPNPGTLGQTQVYFQQGYVNGQLVRTRATEQTQPVELLTHAENIVLLTRNGGSAAIAPNLFNRLLQARIRSVTDPTGTLGAARQEVIGKNTPSSFYIYRNLIIGSSRDGLTLDLAPPTTTSNGQLIVKEPFPLSNGLGFHTLNTMTILNDGTVANSIQPQNFILNPLNYWNLGGELSISAGGRISILANGDIKTADQLATTGVYSGGSILLAATGGIRKSSEDVGADLSTKNGLHGGSIMMKAGQDVIHSYAPDLAFGTTNVIRSDGQLMGGDIYLQAKAGDVNNDVFSEITANGALQGGFIHAYAGNNVLNHAIGPRFQDEGGLMEASGTGANGLGGFIHLHGGNTVANQLGIIQANGGLNGGTIALTGGDKPGATGWPSTSGLFGGPQWLVKSLTPPLTTVTLGSQDQTATILNENRINALGGASGHDGKIYLGGNHGVSFWENGFNNGPVSQVKAHGGHVYVVAGTQLQNQSQPGFQTATQIVDSQAAPNHSEPNVNPLQNAQGSELPDDFKFPPMP